MNHAGRIAAPAEAFMNSRRRKVEKAGRVSLMWFSAVGKVWAVTPAGFNPNSIMAATRECDYESGERPSFTSDA
jgi:hypothetical protein